MILDITPGAELPDRTIIWQEADGTPIDFTASPHTFKLVIDFPTPVEKTAGITGAANGLVTIAFAVGETDSYPEGHVAAQLWAKRTADNKDREPVRLLVHVQA
ncbi:MAG TPA: hypothetical protein VIP28_07305 [Nocardioides sp.]